MRTRFYLDENLPIAVATQLQRRGIEAVTVRDLGFLGDSDHNHLARATRLGYVLCTNDADYVELATTGIEPSLTVLVGLLNQREEPPVQITISIPDMLFVAEPLESISRKIRLYAALGLYRARELSIGAACELAGVDRYTFLDFCERQGVVRQTQTPTELEAEFHRLIEE